MLPGTDILTVVNMMPVPCMYFLSGFVDQPGPICIIKEEKKKIIFGNFSWEFRPCCHCLQGIPINMIYLKIEEWDTLYEYPVNPFSTPTLRILNALETSKTLEFLIFDETGEGIFGCKIDNPLFDLKVHCLNSVRNVSPWDDKGYATAVLLLKEELTLKERWNSAGRSLRERN